MFFPKFVEGRFWMNSINPVSTAVTAFGRITIVVDRMSKVGDSRTKAFDRMTTL